MATTAEPALRRAQSEPRFAPNSHDTSTTSSQLVEASVAPSLGESPAPNFPPNSHPIPPVQDTVEPVPRPPPPVDRRSRWTRLINFFGVGRTATHERKTLVSVVWNLVWGFIQVTVITVVLILCGVYFKDPTKPELSEWKSCDRPLGVWAALWIGRVLLASTLAFWEFRRDRLLHSTSDPESRNGSRTNGNGQAAPNAGDEGRDDDLAASSSCLPSSLTYSRLTLASSLITLSWFLTAHVLAYTSINSCRYTSPHLWWLVFGIMGILYLMILEVVVLGVVVLVIAPILFILWNIILICLGRHPMQNPGVITPDIGKLSKAEVDKIPLRLYIPPPPPPPTDEDGSEGKDPEKQHEYPPKPLVDTPPRTVQNPFLRLLSNARGKVVSTEAIDPVDPYWASNWEKPDHPFVMLDSHRASCVICLMDFEEPKRKVNQDGAKGDIDKNKNNERDKSTKDEQTNTEIESTSRAGAPESSPVPDVASGSHTEGGGDLKLPHAGEGAQPLRLLDCGHAFHKTCVDPWLTDVSGRCPVCQRAVEPKRPAQRS